MGHYRPAATCKTLSGNIVQGKEGPNSLFKSGQYKITQNFSDSHLEWCIIGSKTFFFCNYGKNCPV